MCLRILLFLNNRSIAYFCGWRGWGRSQNYSLFDIINVRPLRTTQQTLLLSEIYLETNTQDRRHLEQYADDSRGYLVEVDNDWLLLTIIYLILIVFFPIHFRPRIEKWLNDTFLLVFSLKENVMLGIFINDLSLFLLLDELQLYRDNWNDMTRDMALWFQYS